MPSEPDPSFAEPRALHPATIVLGVPLLQLAQALIVPAAAALTAGGRVTVWILATIVIGGIVVRTLAWRRFRYAFDGSVVRVSRGVVSRHQHTVEVARIQQVELERSLAHRLLGVTTVRIETAGGGADLELRVLADDDAVALRTAIRRQQPSVPANGEGGGTTAPAEAGHDEPAVRDAPARTERADGQRVILTVPIRHVALAAVTGRQLLVLPAVIGAGLQLLGRPFTDRVGALIRWFARNIEALLAGDVTEPVARLANVTPLLAVGVVAAALIAIAVVAAALVGIVRDGGFVVRQDGSDLVVQRGLLSTRSSTIPLRRVHLVQVVANPLRRSLGFSAVRIHSAGRGSGADRRVVVPLMRHDHALRLAQRLLTAEHLPRLTAHPRAAGRRAAWRWLRRLPPAALAGALALEVARSDLRMDSTVLGGLADIATGRARSLVVIAVISGLVALLLAWSEYRLLGHASDDRVLVTRTGALGVVRKVAPLWRVQATTLHSSWLQRRLGLASVTAHTAGAGGDVTIADVARPVGARRHRQLTAHAARPAVTPRR